MNGIDHGEVISVAKVDKLSTIDWRNVSGNSMQAIVPANLQRVFPQHLDQQLHIDDLPDPAARLAFGQLALPEAACSVGPCLRLPSGCPQASANQPPGLRWPAVPGLTFDTAMEHHVLGEVGEAWTLVRVREVAGVHLQCGRRLLRVRIVHEQHAQPVARTQPPVLLLVSRR